MVPQGYKFFGVQTVQMGYCTPKWGTVGNPASDRPSTLSFSLSISFFTFSSFSFWDIVHMFQVPIVSEFLVRTAA